MVNDNLRVIHLKGGGQMKLPRKQLALNIPEFTKQLEKFIKREKLNYDLISCHYYFSGLIGIRIKNIFKTPLVITFHTLALMKNLVAKTTDEMENTDRIKAEIMLMNQADKVIATSSTDARYMETLYDCPKSKIFVLTPGIDHKLFKPLLKEACKVKIGADLNHKLILFVGRIQPLKGIDVLLYALKNLIQGKMHLDICLWIVGEDSNGKRELKRLLKLQKLLNLHLFVKFIGKKKHHDLPYYYNSAEVVIMPSQYESFGITTLEAMACGVPVITTDVTGVSNIYDKKHRSLITSASNPNLLAQKIDNLLTDKSRHKILSREVAENVKSLSWNEAAGKFSMMIKNLN
ncbi:glycosyltransferase [Candidatus Daviesbacteria bacterium]|nr:glycosyltransferase [Candidatus Daviesbacteria bacterium]